MVAASTLNRSAEKITSYIQRYVTLAGAEKREEVLALFDNMSQVFPNWAIMTCPFMHPDLHYLSANAESIFGYNVQYILSHASVDKSFEHIHFNDQDDLLNCFHYMHRYYEELDPELHYQHRSVLHYRFKKPDGQYLYLHDERAVINLQGSGNLYVALFRDITEERVFNGVKIETFQKDQRLVKIAEYKPSAERKMLTPREGEVVSLLKRGNSTKEIAWYLKISHHTVRNIKSRLFEKYAVNNTVELLNMTA